MLNLIDDLSTIRGLTIKLLTIKLLIIKAMKWITWCIRFVIAALAIFMNTIFLLLMWIFDGNFDKLEDHYDISNIIQIYDFLWKGKL